MKKVQSRFDALGDRMKEFEMMEAGRRLMPGLPIMVRLDGRSFHTFTKGMPRPFHEPMSLAMIETAKYLVEETNACFAYTQSDEISLGYWNENDHSETLFNGRVEKLCSVLAGLATAKFNHEVIARMPERAKLLPIFDARVFNMPNLDEMVNCILFRALDCAKNSITMAASAYYSHKELHGKGGAAKHEMLRAKGVNWADYPSFFKDGSFLRRETFLKELTPQELARIPEHRRPTGPVQRSAVRVIDMPPFARVANPKEVLFNGAAPVLRTEASVSQLEAA
jgi:tRNA(His) 5'-end guanylyltransferase